ncbi:MAG: alpha/beta hydrolase [Prochlorococcaceae cyanobacterium ETNP18_MAG_17]|nr:alpha/beta hydrolase [Prochlorococcaceae cyanobacterium ETNP18_MAG_17]
MKQVIAMHGWCGDSNTWQLWKRHFQAHDWLWQSNEQGYGALPPLKAAWHNESEPQTKQRQVVISHSLGPHLLASEVLRQATDLVLLASFGRFLPKGPASRALRTGLRGMQERLGSTDESAMLQAFLARAAQPSPISAIPAGPIQQGLSLNGRKQLQTDLELLIKTDGLPAGLPAKARVLVVEAEQDSIVVPAARTSLIDALLKHLKSPPCHWKLPDAGHALLVPGLIERVHDWLESAQ